MTIGPAPACVIAIRPEGPSIHIRSSLMPRESLRRFGVDCSVQDGTAARNGGPVVDEIRDELFELFDAVRCFVHVQEPGVPGGLPCVVERLRGKLFFACEMTVDSTLLQTSRLHQVVQGTALVTALIEDWGGRLHDLPTRLFAFGHEFASRPRFETDRSL